MNYVAIGVIHLFSVVLMGANPDNFYNHVTRARTVQDISSVLDESRIQTFGEGISRVIENEYYHVFYDFNYLYGGKYKRYQIKLIVKEGSIKYGQIIQFHWRNTVERSNVFISDIVEIQQLTEIFNAVYESEFEPDSFLKEINKVREYTFGCGDGMLFKPKEASQVLFWIRRNKDRKFVKWLKNPNRELQAYAVYGLLRLKEKGIELSDMQDKLLEHILEQNVVINNCSGCISGLRTPIRDLVTF